MINQEKDISHIPGTVLFFVLFLFFALSFSAQSQISNGRLPVQYESVYGNDNCQPNAVPIELFRLPDLQRNPGYLSHNLCPDLFNAHNLLSGYDRSMAQSFISVHKKQLNIIPAPARKFYIHPAAHSSDDLPALS
jgi:hypothetical protein